MLGSHRQEPLDPKMGISRANSAGRAYVTALYRMRYFHLATEKGDLVSMSYEPTLERIYRMRNAGIPFFLPMQMHLKPPTSAMQGGRAGKADC